MSDINRASDATAAGASRPDSVFNLLAEQNVLADTPTGVTTTEEFVGRLHQIEKEIKSLTQEERELRLEEFAGSPEQAEVITQAVADDTEFVATLLTLAEMVPEAPARTIVRAAPQLQQFGEQPARNDGAPSGFVPIRGDQIATVTGLFPRSILYVWLDDCDECDMVKQTFNDMFDQKPDGVELFAAYGPKWAELLHTEYDIKGGPVVAYMVRDEIDVRMYGARVEEIYQKELEELKKTPLPWNS